MRSTTLCLSSRLTRRAGWGLSLAGWALVVGAVLPAQVAQAQTPAPDSHTVRPGDTLWDLARQYMGDPFLWPEIYRLNTLVVEDPHWIYPGEVLRLQPGEGVSAVPAQDTPSPEAAVEQGDTGAAGSEMAQADTEMVQPDTGMAPADTAEVAAQGVVPEGQIAEVTEAEENRGDDADLRVLFGPKRTVGDNGNPILVSQRLFRPVRRSEFYSSGFLSEEQKMPYGLLIGPVTPPQISSITNHSTSYIYSQVAIRPPAGAKYQVGDTVLVLRVDRAIPRYGDVIVPTAIARILDVSRPENLAEIIGEYAAVNNDQLVLPIEKFADLGPVRPVPIAEGIDGHVIQSRDKQDLKGPQDILFIDRGRLDGVALGDIFEVRQSPTKASHQQEGASSIDELKATFQIVHVGDHTATGRIVRVTAPDIHSGDVVKQVAKLPS